MKKAIFFAIILFSLPSFSHAQLVTIQGFEAASALEAGMAGTASAVSTQAKYDTYSLRTNPTTSGTGYISLFDNNSSNGQPGTTAYNSNDLYFQFWFRAATLPASGSEPIALSLGSGSFANKYFLMANSDGTLTMRNSSNVSLATSSTALSLNTWYHIQAYVGTGTSANYEVKINGVSEMSGTGNFTTEQHNRLRLGKPANNNSQSVDFYIDDVLVSESGFLSADARTKLALPNAAGTYSAWTAGTNSSDYLEVDEAPSDTSTYTESTANGDKFTVNYQDTSTLGITGTILGIRCVSNTAEATSGSDIYQSVFISGATEVNKSSITSHIVNYTIFSGFFYTTDPNTSAAWTSSGVDGIECGGQEIASSAVRMRMTQSLLFIAYVPDAGGGGTPGKDDGIIWFNED